MIFYPDTIAMSTPEEGYVSSSLEIEFDEASETFGLESRKFSGMFNSGLVDATTTDHLARLVDGQIGSDTEVVNRKILVTSASKTFLTSDGETFRTNDNTDIGFLFNLSEEKTIDFFAAYINSISGSGSIKLFGANSAFKLVDSDGKYFYTSDGDLFLTGDDPDSFFVEISSLSVSSTGWNVLDLTTAGYSDGVSYKHFLLQFVGTFTVGLGEAILGQKTKPSINPAMGREYGKEDNVFIKEAYDGSEFSYKVGNSAITRRFFWDSVSDTDKTAFERLRDNSHHKKFLFYDGSSYYYVGLADMQITEVANGMSSVNMSFAE